MSSAGFQSAFRYQPFHILAAFICVLSLLNGVPVLSAQEPELTPNEKLDALVAPIALYPDPLLAQTLAASTYPLEVIQLQQWIATNKYLKDQVLADVVEMQPPLSLELYGEATASRVDRNAPLCRGNAD